MKWSGILPIVVSGFSRYMHHFWHNYSKFWAKRVSKTYCMLDFQLDYGQWELALHLQDAKNTSMWLHVACKLHALTRSCSGAFFVPLFGNLDKFEQLEATCIVRQLHCSLLILKMQVELFSFLIVYLPIEFGSEIVLNRSTVWHFWCHCFAWSCMHHTTMPCTCFAY